MVKPSEELEFDLVCKDIQKIGYLTTKHKEWLAHNFGIRFLTASQTLQEGKIKKYIFTPSGRILWIVTGKKRNYQILPKANFCSCFDFYFRVINHETIFCYHLIAQKLADALNKYDVINESDTSFTRLMNELLMFPDQKRKFTIAKVEEVRKVASEILFKKKEVVISTLLETLMEGGFERLTTRHLVNILTSDKAKRFKCTNGLWTLSFDQ